MSKQELLPISSQCGLLGLARSTYYYAPKPVGGEELELMKLIDQCYLELPFYGTRRIKDWLLDKHGLVVNRKRIQRLRRLMAIETLYPKRNLSLANQQHKVYPYLLKGLDINRPNQVWATDITFIPMAKGFVYLVAIMDWYSRRVLSWRVSTTKEVARWLQSNHGVSVRMACAVACVSESCFRYSAKLSSDNILIADWLLRLTQTHKKWGFGLCFLYLRNVKHFPWNYKRVYRIYRVSVTSNTSVRRGLDS